MTPDTQAFVGLLLGLMLSAGLVIGYIAGVLFSRLTYVSQDNVIVGIKGHRMEEK